jgi:homoserine O-succinyltransferase
LRFVGVFAARCITRQTRRPSVPDTESGRIRAGTPFRRIRQVIVMSADVRPTDLRDGFRIGIVDLMASTARGAAQAQFTRLLRSAADGSGIDARVDVVNLDPTDSWPRPPGTRAVWDRIAAFDALVVTGAEPRAAGSGGDPCFPVVEKILGATAPNAVSVIFSCLAAHAALKHLYAIPRQRFGEKLVGVLTHVVSADPSPLTTGLPDLVAMPHSRWNTVRLEDLTAAGVRPVMCTGSGEWAAATSPDGIRYVFLQGHPEYFADTLLREYRRDVRRYIEGLSETYPALPTGYLPAADVEALNGFAGYARRHRQAHALAEFPAVGPDPAVARAWATPAAALAANWTNRVTGLANV